MERVLKSTYGYYLKLESETSVSTSDSESVLSFQGKETDLAQDTSDTDTKSEYSSDNIFEVEYDVASLSEVENPFLKEESSSGSEDIMVGAAIAAAICNSSMEPWITDVEDSDTSLDEIGLSLPNYSTCIQCKSRNDNRRFSYCEKCFQRCWQCKNHKNFSGFPLCSKCYKDRKTLFPPRPRRFRPRKKPVEPRKQRVTKENLQSCLNGLSSQDSGVGTSQELCKLNLDKIVVPKHLHRKRAISYDSESLLSESDVEPSQKKIRIESTKEVPKEEVEDKKQGTKRRAESEEDEEAKIKRCKNLKEESVPTSLSPICSTSSETIQSCSTISTKELCISCNSQPKNSIFLHGKTGHMCCCYKCAVRTWHTIKSCPICKMKVQNVVKVFVCS